MKFTKDSVTIEKKDLNITVGYYTIVEFLHLLNGDEVTHVIGDKKFNVTLDGDAKKKTPIYLPLTYSAKKEGFSKKVARNAKNHTEESEESEDTNSNNLDAIVKAVVAVLESKEVTKTSKKSAKKSK